MQIDISRSGDPNIFVFIESDLFHNLNRKYQACKHYVITKCLLGCSIVISIGGALMENGLCSRAIRLVLCEWSTAMQTFFT